jgi:GNAT superfamily N-acetyltransferase
MKGLLADIIIKEANVNDIPIIQKLANETWPATFSKILSKEQIAYMMDMMYSENSLSSQMNEKQHQFILASDSNGYYGFASYELDYHNTNKTKIHKIYILPNQQGRKIGSRLIGHIEKIALTNKNLSLTLNVNRFNEAISFYHKIGFKTILKEDIKIGNGFLMEDYVMEKAII